jgi:hypothetical protein
MAGMDMEAQIAVAIRQELQRQADETSRLTIKAADGSFDVEGTIDLEALAMAIVGAVAGGP